MFYNWLTGVVDNATSSNGSGSVVDTWNYQRLFQLSILISFVIIILLLIFLTYRGHRIEKLEEENKELQKVIKELKKKE